MTTKLNRNILLTVGVLACSSVSWGQHLLMVNVPFDFATPSGKMPAGRYQIVTGLGTSAKIVIFRPDTKKSALLLAGGPVYENNPSEKAKLVFDCDSEGCSLSRILPGGNGQAGLWFPEHRSAMGLKTNVATVSVPALP